MISNRMCEDRAASAKTRLRAMRGCCHSPSGSPEFGLTVEMREIAARYVEPQAVPTAEQIGDREQLDGDRIDLARHHQCRPLPAVAIAHPQQALGQVYRQAVREVRAQVGRELGVRYVLEGSVRQ